MGYYVKVLEGKVIDGMNAEANFFDTFVDSSPGTWLETWKDANGQAKKRYNYASVGSIYDSTNDAFYQPKNPDWPSWKLDDNFQWQPPVPHPDETIGHQWNEETKSWDAPESE